MAEKIKQPEWHPDFGLAERHPTAGTVAIGARMPLVAYNINLNTPSIVGSEIIGLVPMEALIDTASYYLGLENFSMEQVLEARM